MTKFKKIKTLITCDISLSTLIRNIFSHMCTNCTYVGCTGDDGDICPEFVKNFTCQGLKDP